MPEKCRKCHAPLPEDAAYCPKCGAKQDIKQNPKRRGNGTGSVYKLPNGSWIAVVVKGWYLDEEGKKHKHTPSKSGFKTKKEALAYLPILAASTPAETRKSITLQALYEKWEPTWRAGKSTMGNYHAAFNYFRPLWLCRVSDIDIDDLQGCLDDCPRGKRTRENMKALTNLLYKYAIPRHMATLNLGPYLVVTGEEGSGKQGLPLDALEKLTRVVDTVPYADYAVADCYLGFRPSELLALDVQDYDREQRAFVGGAKTDAGRDRIVTVSPKIQPIIDRLVDGKTSGPVFCGPTGSALGLKAYRALFYDALAASGIDNPILDEGGVKRRTYTPHSCRHTFATLMKAVQAPDKDKLSLIGHSSTEMLRHYQDVDYSSLRRITDAL